MCLTFTVKVSFILVQSTAHTLIKCILHFCFNTLTVFYAFGSLVFTRYANNIFDISKEKREDCLKSEQKGAFQSHVSIICYS